jgi:hypothetical protein
MGGVSARRPSQGLKGGNMSQCNHSINCPGCHQPVRRIEQPSWRGGVISLVICDTSGCALETVLLEISQQATLTAIEIEGYALINAKRRRDELAAL